MPDFAMALILNYGVDAIDLAKKLVQVGLPRMHDEMVVISHQEVCEETRIEAIQGSGANVHKGDAIDIIVINGVAPVTSGREVVERTWKFETKLGCNSWHPMQESFALNCFGRLRTAIFMGSTLVH